MWTRKELKDKAKISVKANYWKTVLVALLVMIAIGGAGSYSSATSIPASSVSPYTSGSLTTADTGTVDVGDGSIKVDLSDEGGSVHVNVGADDAAELAEVLDNLPEDEAEGLSLALGPGAVLVGLAALLAALVVIAVVLAFVVFVFSPLEVGGERSGSGLGLSICKRVADMHGFDLLVVQPYGRFAKAFVLQCPVSG